jgi:maltose O-acetyltransferase
VNALLTRAVEGVLAKVRQMVAELDDARQKKSLHFCGENVKIYPPVIFYGAEALDVGANTSVAPFVHIWCGGRVVIGANCMIGSHVAISSLTHDYSEAEMSRTMVAKPVHIEDGVWIGSHAVIMPGTRVGKGAVVGAGSVVTKDVPPYAIVYGVPATIQDYRKVTE